MVEISLSKWRYSASATETHDGDTFKASFDLGSSRSKKAAPPVDLGLHVYVEAGRIRLHWPVRLLGCNAIELAQPGGAEAQQALAGLITGKILTIETHLDETEKYGRVLGKVTLPDGTDVTTWMIANQWAAAWDGSGARPTPPWPRTVTP